MVSTVASLLLSSPPYNLTGSGIGLFNLASFAGVVVGYPIAGPLTDFLSRALRRRNHSETHNPEDRLPVLVVPFLVAPPGLLLVGYIFHKQHSVYIAAVGFAIQVSALVLVPSCVLSVVVDGWPASGSEALVLINAGKNAVSFGLLLSTTDWMADEGLVKMCWEMAAIQWAVLALGPILYFWGPWLRKKTQWLL
jgi:MFS family permease